MFIWVNFNFDKASLQLSPPLSLRYKIYSKSELLTEKLLTMLRWTITFIIIAIIAAILGFGGIAGAAAGIAKIIFFIFLVLFILSLLKGGLKR